MNFCKKINPKRCLRYMLHILIVSFLILARMLYTCGVKSCKLAVQSEIVHVVLF